MGRMIESLVSEFDAEIAGWVDSTGDPLPADFDVAIDFSEPSAVLGNVLRIAAARRDLVIGTTGWADDREEVQRIVEDSGIACVHSANFSVGVNMFFRIVADAAVAFADKADYEAWGYEMHHSAKKDAPSGTMLHLVETMQQAGYELPVDVSSNRAGRVPGTHTIGFDSAADTITLTHTARNREGFARGALLAAELIRGKPGFHRFADLL